MFLESKELPEQVSELADMHGDMTIAFYDRVEKQIILGAQPEYLDWEAEAGDNDRWRARIKAMGKDRKRYLELYPPPSYDGYDTMLSFTQQLPEGEYKRTLQVILRGQKPFRNFKDYLADTPSRDDFFAYRQRETEQYYWEEIREFEEE